MKKRPILVDVFYLHVAQTGIKTYIECLCQEIARSESVEFEFIISPSRESIAGSNFFKGKTALWKNLLFHTVYFFRKLVVLPVLSMIYRSDIVLSPDILSPPWANGIKVSVIHDAFFWENPGHYNSLWLKVYLTMLRLGLKKNAQVITISEYSKNQIQKYLALPSLPVHVVYPSSNIRLKKSNLLHDPPLQHPYFLHVGVMEKRKNLLVLIEAFAQFVNVEEFRNYYLVLVGQRGPRRKMDHFDNILSLTEKLGLKGKVILPGYVDQQKLDNYYRHAVGYVFPSLNEGFGMPILEAFSYRLPVIIADQETLKEVGGDAVFTVVENSSLGFSKAMTRLAEDEGLRQTLAAKGLERLQLFSSDNFFLSLKNCLRRILNE